MENRNVEAVESYFNGLKQRDLSKVPFAPDVIFEGPLAPDKLHGVESLIEFLSGVLPIVKDVRIKRHIADGEHVCVLWNSRRALRRVLLTACLTKNEIIPLPVMDSSQFSCVYL
jgi:hypothetical protein